MNCTEPVSANGLHQDVPNCGGLDRASVHWPAAGIGSELAEQGVLGPATNHVNRCDRCGQDRFEALDDPPVLERKTFETAADYCAFITWNGLSGAGAKNREPGGSTKAAKAGAACA